MGAGQSQLQGSTLLLQDLEKVQFGNDLRKNPSDYAQYVGDRVNQIADEANNRKRAAFQKAHIDLGRYMDMEHNANNYELRNMDVAGIQDVIEKNNNSIRDRIMMDKDNSKRQFEINEYFYYNKLETLFFLQIFFMAALAMAIIYYLQKTILITTRMAGLLTTLLLIAVILTGVGRYFYTQRTRDHRLWNRRYFKKETPAEVSLLKCDNGGNITMDLDTVFNTQCASSAVKGLQARSDALMEEIRSYQESGVSPASLIPGGGVQLPSCSA